MTRSGTKVTAQGRTGSRANGNALTESHPGAPWTAGSTAPTAPGGDLRVAVRSEDDTRDRTSGPSMRLSEGSGVLAGNSGASERGRDVALRLAPRVLCPCSLTGDIARVTRVEENEGLRRYIDAGMSFTEVTRARAQDLVR